MIKIPIAGPGYQYLIPVVLITVLAYYKSIFLFTVFLVFTMFVAFFFRNPARKPPGGNDLILAPADGRIIKIERVYEHNFIEGEAIKIRIFLSILDVHINRSPYHGTIPFQQHIPGRFLAAFKEEAPLQNERNLIGILTGHGKILVVQIAGKVARRIVTWIKTGDFVEPGMPIGMIKFGSCTELYLPPDVIINVKEGDRVRGGETVLGEFQGGFKKTNS
jgi:phosphatidylserine decarboxylase